MIAKYCPYCGEKLIKKEIGDEGFVPYCDKCERPIFPMPCPCVIILCRKSDDSVVLIRQSYGKDNFVLVAGYAKLGESLEECVIREVKEELGLDAFDVTYVGSYFQESKENIMVGYCCKVSNDEIVLSGEVKEAVCVKLEDAKDLLKEATIASKLLDDFLTKKSTK